MKQTITIADLNLITGKFILELNIEDFSLKLTDDKARKNIDFYLEKRILWISYGGEGIIQTDLFGGSHTITKEKFVEWFNDYVGDSKGTRFHRILYSKELDIIFDFIKSRNY